MSERIPQRRRPAVCGDGSRPASMNRVVMIVQVEPTGSFRNRTGLRVEIAPSRWWSMISRMSASSIPSTAWAASLWSSRITAFWTSCISEVRERSPRYRPSSSTTHAVLVLRGRDQVLGMLERVLERDRRDVGLHDLPGRGREVEPPAHGERVEPGGEDRDVLGLRRVHHALADGCAVRNDHRGDPRRDQGQLRGLVVPDDRDVVGGQTRERDVQRVDRGVDPALDLLVRADEHGRGEDPGQLLEQHRRDRERLLLLAGHVRTGQAVLGDEPGEAPVRVDDRDVPHVGTDPSARRRPQSGRRPAWTGCRGTGCRRSRVRPTRCRSGAPPGTRRAPISSRHRPPRTGQGCRPRARPCSGAPHTRSRCRSSPYRAACARSRRRCSCPPYRSDQRLPSGFLCLGVWRAHDVGTKEVSIKSGVPFI